MDTDPKEQRMLDDATSVWDYLRDYYLRHPENGGQGSGGSAMPPSATPAPQASSPPFSTSALSGGQLFLNGGKVVPSLMNPFMISAGALIQ